MVAEMAEKLASSSVDRILNLIDDALDDGPCWRCQVRMGTQQSGLCDPCRVALRSETTDHTVVPVPIDTDLRCGCGRARITGSGVFLHPEVVVECRHCGGPLVRCDDTHAIQGAIVAVQGAIDMVGRMVIEFVDVACQIVGYAQNSARFTEPNSSWPSIPPSVPGRPRRKPPRTCPRHAVVMTGGLCRRCCR